MAPEGVERLDVSNQSVFDAINQYRASATPNASVPENNTINPTHNFETSYRYNSLNQLVWQNTPDGGTTRFAYDKLGRIVLSQNSKQLATNVEKSKYAASYTKYDALGRIVEAGEITTDAIINEKGYLDGYDINDATFPENIIAIDGSLPIYKEVTKTVYDTEVIAEYDEDGTPIFSNYYFVTDFNKFNLRNRVAAILYYNTITSDLETAVLSNAIFYNYDIHGNVKETVNYIGALKQDCSVIGSDCEAHIKRVAYKYDLISGNVKEVVFQPNYDGLPRRPDYFAHRYSYDADNRIISVKTSKDGHLWETDATYDYYAHGPLARVELGERTVQGMDYVYNLQGWLKSVNGENIQDIHSDFADDGIANSNYGNVGRDAMGYTLNYFEGDYKARIGDDGSGSLQELQISRNDPASQNPSDLFNGNIKAMFTGLTSNTNAQLATMANAYSYDQLNRIKSFNSYQIGNSINEMHSAQYSYDKNGNIQTLSRKVPQFRNNGNYLGTTTIDAFSYNYTDNTNQLQLVGDTGQNIIEEDLKDQISTLAELGINYSANDASTHNYVYDEIGQLIEDKSEGLKINWRTDGKIDNILKLKKVKSQGSTIYTENGAQTIDFEYDGLGNRIAKAIYKPEENLKDFTFYGRDAQGNVLSIYKGVSSINAIPNVEVNENYIYGSSRLGMDVPDGSTYAYSPPSKPGNGFGRPDALYAPIQFDNSGEHSLLTNENISFIWPGSYYIYDSPETLPMSNISFNTRLKVNNLPAATGYIGQIQHYQENERIEDTKEYTVNFYLKNNGSDLFAFEAVVTRLQSKLIPGPSIEYTSRTQIYTTPYQFNSEFLINANGFNLEFNYEDDAATCQNVLFEIGDLVFEPGNNLICNTQIATIPSYTRIADNIENELGGDATQAATFQLCYLNYKFEPYAITTEGPIGQSFNEIFNFNGTAFALFSASGTMMTTDASEADYLASADLCFDLTADEDGDGILNQYEVVIENGEIFQFNTDGDSKPDYKDPDDDGDGILTIYEWGDLGDVDPSTVEVIDTDGDGIYNYLDKDDDNDEIATRNENADPDNDGNPQDAEDEDGDGIPNYLDDTNGIFPVPGPISYKYFAQYSGDKRYELTNHLGNVLTVVNDKKLAEVDGSGNLLYFKPEVLAYNDYYPKWIVILCRYN